MNHSMYKKLLPLAVAMTMIPTMAAAFDSGSTEADGAFTPTVNTQLTLPADGIFNFTNVNIPTGVTVTFQRNATNTPVTILASGDVTINGMINVSGGRSTDVGTAGGGNVGDDGLPGLGGSGGFDGGAGGNVNSNLIGATGLGPGGGFGGANALLFVGVPPWCGGGGAGYGASGVNAAVSGATRADCRVTIEDRVSGTRGVTYGSATLLPIIGGSGGGGGQAGESFSGSGGGGAGGAILVAASGTVLVNGSLLADGGASGNSGGSGAGSTGGGGSGGAIRIVATTLAGNGTIRANGGAGGAASLTNSGGSGGNGGVGRIRLEADTFTFSATTTPSFAFAEPQDIFVPGLPNLRITSVAGVVAPASPTGTADILLPAGTANPVTVAFVSSGVPVGNTVQLTVTPASAPPTSTLSGALSGDLANATASATIELPEGPSTLSAQVSFTVTASIGDDMSRFAQGERVERIVVAAGMDGSSETVLITVSGKEYRYSGELPDLGASQAAS